MDFAIDNEFQSRLRKLSKDELDGLEKLLAEKGCLNPLLIWDEGNILLDGHTRHEICTRLGIPFETKRISFANRDEAMLWVLRHQRDKRNCTDGEKYFMTREIREILAVKGRERQAHGQTAPGRSLLSNIDKGIAHNTQKEIADDLGWATGKVAQADYVWEHGSDCMKKRLLSGEYSVNQAYRKAKRRQEKVEREFNQCVIPEHRDNVDKTYTLLSGDLAAMGNEVADASIDWIITDPPYTREFLPVYESLGCFAATKLKPGGSLVCMMGQSYLPEVVAALSKHMRYHWALAYLTPGGQAVQLWDRKVNAFWKPLLWFVKGEYAGEWIGDVCKSKPNDNDKRYHEWGQSESGMADILERFTKPGDLVCDPFCGGGATGMAALAMGRRFLGIDIDPSCIATTRRRLQDAAAAIEGRFDFS